MASAGMVRQTTIGLQAPCAGVVAMGRLGTGWIDQTHRTTWLVGWRTEARARDKHAPAHCRAACAAADWCRQAPTGMQVRPQGMHGACVRT